MLVFLATIVYGTTRFSQVEQTASIDNLRQTIDDKMLLCYINEGRYPGSLEYLEDHYQLAFDESQYQVYLIPIGENLKPDVTVIINE